MSSHSQKIFIDKVTVMLRCHREAAGMSQSELADRLKIGLRSYQRYESGESIPSIDIIYLISQILNFNLKDFFAPHELKDFVPGLRLFTGEREHEFQELPNVRESNLLNFFNSPEYKQIVDSGDIRNIRNCEYFMKSNFPMALSSPRGTILNPVAQKKTGFHSDSISTSVGQNDPKHLAAIWGILMDHETLFFEQETTPTFPKGKFKMIARAAFSNVNQHYMVLSVLDFEELPQN